MTCRGPFQPRTTPTSPALPASHPICGLHICHPLGVPPHLRKLSSMPIGCPPSRPALCSTCGTRAPQMLISYVQAARAVQPCTCITTPSHIVPHPVCMWAPHMLTCPGFRSVAWLNSSTTPRHIVPHPVCRLATTPVSLSLAPWRCSPTRSSRRQSRRTAPRESSPS